jgi:hypothetical protein
MRLAALSHFAGSMKEKGTAGFPVTTPGRTPIERRPGGALFRHTLHFPPSVRVFRVYTPFNHPARKNLLPSAGR